MFLIVIYLFYLLVFYDLNEQSIVGKGFVNKISIILFDEGVFRNIFIYFSFFISWLVILIYIDNKLIDVLTISYFFILSIFLWPIHQEYFDPLILLMVFTFFDTKVILNYRNSIALYFYLFLLIISANIYYFNLLN